MLKISYFAHVKRRALGVMALLLLELCGSSVWAQVNSGSDGSDGAFNPTQSVTIDMADHPDGIYQYTTVNIPSGVAVAFKPNANNSPVVWLVQDNCVINGAVSVSGGDANAYVGGIGGPGGYLGGSSGSNPTSGQGLGGGSAGVAGGAKGEEGANASHATSGTSDYQQAGPVYGNSFNLPLMGGSGGGGGHGSGGGGGGGGAGAILVAASNLIQLDGAIIANGGNPPNGGGSGSAGGIRLVSTNITGSGTLSATGGLCYNNNNNQVGGSGWIRFDTYQNNFGGTIVGVFSQGFQPIIIPSAGQGVQLAITSVGGTAISGNPTGVLTNPDVIISDQQSNPMPIVVSCTSLPLNTAITVVAHPASGTDVQAVGVNNIGTMTSSTATVSMNLPQGGGIIYADCLSGTTTSSSSTTTGKTQSYAKTGLTTDGERISAVEIIAKAGAPQQTVYRTPSGKRLMVANK